MVHCYGGDDPKQAYSVAILICYKLQKLVLDFNPLGQRVMFLRILTTHRVINVIEAYAPTTDKADENEEFYLTLEVAMNITMKGEMTLWDFNGKIGEGADGGDVSDQLEFVMLDEVF